MLGTLYVRLVGQTDDLNKKMEESESKVKKHSKGMEEAAEHLKGVLEALGLAFGLAEIVHFVKETIEATDQLQKLSVELGIGIEKLAGFKYAADKANIGDQFQIGMRKFSASIREAMVEGSNMQALFRQLKIDPNQLPEKVFKETVARFGEMEDGINKLGLAQELFGIRNARFVNLLSQGEKGLDKDIQELARITGISYEEAAEKAEAYNSAMTELHYALQGLVLTMTNEALPVITEWTSELSENLPLLKEYAREIGFALVLAIETAVTAFKGFMGAIKSVGIGLLALTEVLMKTARWIAEQLVVAFEFWANAAIKSINFVVDGFNKMADRLPEWVKRRLGIVGVGVSDPIPLFSLGKPTGLDDWIDTIHDAREDLTDQLAADFTHTTKVIQEGNEKVEAAVKDGVKKVKMAGFDPKELELFTSRINKLVGADTPEGLMEFQKMRGGLRSEIAGIKGIDGLSEATQMKEEKDQINLQLKQIEDLRKSHFDMTKEQEKRLTDMEELYSKKRGALQTAEMQLRLHTFSKMSDDILTIGEAFAGKQSAVYKSMFAVSKAFAIAEATVKIALGIAEAAGTPWPLNLFAIASVVAATASVVSSIQAVQLEFGGAREGGGPVFAGKSFLVGEKGPELFVPSNGGSIIPNNRLNGGGGVRVVINNFTDAKPEVTTRQEGDEQVIELIIRRAKDEVAGDIRDGKGSVPRALETTYRMRRG